MNLVASRFSVETTAGAVTVEIDRATSSHVAATALVGQAERAGPLDANFSPTFICAHGAGGNMADRGVLALSAELTQRGITVARFNFAYAERGSKRPDTMPVLQDTLRCVVEEVRVRLEPSHVILGGRSMGGRAASMLVANGFDCAGLVLVAYPLHPPGQPEKQRVSHLSRIGVPVICFNGTRDDFCEVTLMKTALAAHAPEWTMVWLEGADHGLHVLKRSGRTDLQILEELGAATKAWIGRLSREGSAGSRNALSQDGSAGRDPKKAPTA